MNTVRITGHEKAAGEKKLISFNDSDVGSRKNILNLADSFVEQTVKIKKTLWNFSILAIILAPLAFSLAVYLIIHPSFFDVLQTHNEFGAVLIVLLVSVIAISLAWIIFAVKQYRWIDRWNSGYNQFISRQREIDNKIATEFSLDNGVEGI